MTKEIKILDRCPSCDSRSLFLAESGHLTCSRLDCKDPAVGRAIDRLKTRVALAESFKYRFRCMNRVGLFRRECGAGLVPVEGGAECPRCHFKYPALYVAGGAA